MSGLVILFFVGSTVSTLLVGIVFSRQAAPALQRFGWGLLATGVAFVVWSVAIIVKPDTGLDAWVTPGVLVFLLSLIAFVLVWADRVAPGQRLLVGGVAAAYVIAIALLRLAYPSNPTISPEGLFFFNPHGSVAALEVASLVGAVLPGLFEIARLMRPAAALVANVAFTTLIVGGILLITSDDRVLLTIDGWVMGAAFLALLVSFVLRRPMVWLA